VGWEGGPVQGGAIAAWPLRAAPAGPFPGGTGTIANPFNGMCMALAADRTTVVAWKCSPGASTQQWTGYNDGTLRIGGRCLDVTGPGTGAKAKVAACTGAASQKWAIGQVSSNDFGPLINTGTGTALTDPGGSTTNGTPLVMGPDRGDLSGPWRVSFHHYVAP
jgi:Ricin-type beta-trefoil lectin domain